MTDAERLALILQDRSVPMATPTGEFIPTPPLPMQPQTSPYNPIGIGETALSLGTGAMAMPLAGWYGAGTELFGGDGKAAAGRLADALTYKPTTDYGQASASAFSDFADKSGLSSLPPVVSGIPAPRLGAGATRYAGQQYGVPMLEKSLTMYEQGRLTPGMKPVSQMDTWHGSPHEIKGDFSLDYVGTGEGNQSYGHGIYVGQARGTGEKYRENLSSHLPSTVSANTAKVNLPAWAISRVEKEGIDPIIAEWTQRAEQQRTQASKSLQPWVQEANAARFEQELAELLKIKESTNINISKPGNLYKVDLPDEQLPFYIDYDRPIKDQPQVFELIKQGITDPDIRKTFESNAESGITGANAYSNYLSGKTDAERSANAVKLGIMGMKYFDEFSRNLANWEVSKSKDGKFLLKNHDMASSQWKEFPTREEAQKALEYQQSFGTRNFVSFKPDTLKILEKNDVPVTRKELLQQEFDKLDK